MTSHGFLIFDCGRCEDDFLTVEGKAGIFHHSYDHTRYPETGSEMGGTFYSHFGMVKTLFYAPIATQGANFNPYLVEVETVRAFYFPIGALSAIFFAWPLWLSAKWVLRRGRMHSAQNFARGLCPKCGYDLRETPDRCPECGTTPIQQ